MVKVALLAPCGTTTDRGADRFGLLLAIFTVAPPTGAGDVRLTVHEPTPIALKEPAPQLSALSLEGCKPGTGGTMPLGTIETVPALPVIGIVVPADDDATRPVSWIDDEAATAVGEIWALTTATAPSRIRFELIPNSKQVVVLDLDEQEIDLSAAVAAGPADT